MSKVRTIAHRDQDGDAETEGKVRPLDEAAALVGLPRDGQDLVGDRRQPGLREPLAHAVRELGGGADDLFGADRPVHASCPPCHKRMARRLDIRGCAFYKHARLLTPLPFRPTVPTRRPPLRLIRPFLVTLMAVVLSLAATATFAQSDGRLTGIVKDSSGAAVPGAEVTVTNDQTGASQSTISGGDGSFAVSGLAAGAYTVEVKLRGFGSSKEKVNVAAGAAATAEFTLSARLEEEVVVTGTRGEARTTTESMAPIDVLSAKEFEGLSGDLSDQIRTLVPSYNVNTQPISDASTIVRPASLRNLAPDHTLVLINGERRHRAAVINWLGNGVADGAQGPDISLIPVDRAPAGRGAPRRRRGAVRLGRHRGRHQLPAAGHQPGRHPPGQRRDDRRGRRRGLHHQRQQGVQARLARLRQPDRGVRELQPDRPQRPARRRAGPDRRRQHAVRVPAQIFGTPEINDDVKLWLNSGYLFGGGQQLYVIGDYAAKTVDGGFYYRNPNTRAGVFSNDGGATLLIGDVRDARDGVLDGSSNCPVVPIVNNRPDAAAPGPRVRRSQLLLVPGDVPRRLHAPVRRRREGLLGDRRHPRPDRQAPVLGRQRGLRLERGAVLHQQHRERLARPRLPHRVRSRPLQAGRDQPQPEAPATRSARRSTWPAAWSGATRRSRSASGRPNPGSTVPSPTRASARPPTASPASPRSRKAASTAATSPGTSTRSSAAAPTGRWERPRASSTSTTSAPR